VTSLPDWLVERVALDEVPPASRDRIARADARELADRVAALRDADVAELAAYPPGPATDQIVARITAERARRTRRRLLGWLGGASGALAVAALALLVLHRAPTADHSATPPVAETTRVKGVQRLIAFRLAGTQVEQLAEDTLVRAGDLIQLRYNAGGHGFGVIASLDGAGADTLHYPASADAPREATAIPADTRSLPHAYSLDDAPRFERFFFITGDEPIDVQQSLAAMRAFAQRGDSATAALDLPASLHQSSLRLRKP
jgi:hypothetical protein